MEDIFRRVRREITPQDERQFAALERRLVGGGSGVGSSSSVDLATLHPDDEALLRRHGERLARSLSTPNLATLQAIPLQSQSASPSHSHSRAESRTLRLAPLLGADETRRRPAFRTIKPG